MVHFAMPISCRSQYISHQAVIPSFRLQFKHCLPFCNKRKKIKNKNVANIEPFRYLLYLHECFFFHETTGTTEMPALVLWPCFAWSPRLMGLRVTRRACGVGVRRKVACLLISFRYVGSLSFPPFRVPFYLLPVYT